MNGKTFARFMAESKCEELLAKITKAIFFPFFLLIQQMLTMLIQKVPMKKFTPE